MSITINTPEDIAKMRIAGQLAAEVLEMIEPHVARQSSTPQPWQGAVLYPMLFQASVQKSSISFVMTIL